MVKLHAKTLATPAFELILSIIVMKTGYIMYNIQVQIIFYVVLGDLNLSALFGWKYFCENVIVLNDIILWDHVTLRRPSH